MIKILVLNKHCEEWGGQEMVADPIIFPLFHKQDITFSAENISTTPGQIHQYQVDWDALSQGEKGVTLNIDENGDGELEQTIQADATLAPPTAEIKEDNYQGEEGVSIIFDASQSSDPDGQIVNYEWDFDGDGIYEVSSTSATTTHTWGDDYQGSVSLRVTDDEGLTDIATTSVFVNNVVPIVSNLSVEGPAHPNQEIWAGDTLNFSDQFTDPGWLDIHAAKWDFGDGTTSTGVVAEENISPDATGQITGNHIYYNVGTYTVTVTVIDDDGGVVTDTLQAVVKPIPATIRIEPETLNLASKGVFTVFIIFPEGYDVANIDDSTVVCEGATAVKGMISEADKRTYIAKFNREDLENVPTGAAITLGVEGKVLYHSGLADFEGFDTIRGY